MVTEDWAIAAPDTAANEANAIRVFFI